MGTDVKRFPIRFRHLVFMYRLLGMSPSSSWIEVEPDVVRAKMGWAFRTEFPRTSVRSAALDTSRVLGWGVHGWKGEWLVNATADGIVRIAIEPRTCAHVLMMSVRLGVLRIGVEDPNGLIRALTARNP